jgi:hypothetical protein
MLALVNRDRKSEGLGELELDEGPASVAAQAHAEDMARKGYLGHWGSDGSVPEGRLTAAGGADMVLENALCFIDEAERKLDSVPLIDPKEIERAESMFFHETPPNDGHRKNILRPQHKKVGLGFAQPVATPTETPVPCIAQEFIDPYGTYAPIPARVKVGEQVHVEGKLEPPAKPMGVGLARVEAPKPIAVAELNRRRSYPVPSPYVLFWRKGFRTPVPLGVDGQKFAIDVPISDAARPGLYEVSVWAELPGSSEPVMVGLRTLLAE